MAEDNINQEDGAQSSPEGGANVFQDFADDANAKQLSQDINFILDIPVQLTVELGRTKILIKNLLISYQELILITNGILFAM